jgi:hypothetical protein
LFSFTKRPRLRKPWRNEEGRGRESVRSAGKEEKKMVIKWDLWNPYMPRERRKAVSPPPGHEDDRG